MRATTEWLTRALCLIGFGAVTVLWAADLLTLEDGGAALRFAVADSGASRVVANDNGAVALSLTNSGTGGGLSIADGTQGAGKVLTSDGAGKASWQTPSAGGGGGWDYVHIIDQKPDGTDGGTFTSGAWRLRDLNVVVTDSGGNAVLAGNQVTLAAGTWEVEIAAPAFSAAAHRARLFDATNSAVLLLGQDAYSDSSAGPRSVTNSVIRGRFTLASAAALRVEHRAQQTKATNGYGLHDSVAGTAEHYTVFVARKVVAPVGLGGVPAGTIVMWSGTLATIPAGWALCDGAGGTPDLRDRFVLGALAAENPGATGGAHSYSLTVAQLAAHSHAFTTGSAGSHGGHRSGPNQSFGISTATDAPNGTAGNHTHTGTSDTTGTGAAVDNRPGFYKVAFIIKL